MVDQKSICELLAYQLRTGGNNSFTQAFIFIKAQPLEKEKESFTDLSFLLF